MFPFLMMLQRKGEKGQIGARSRRQFRRNGDSLVVGQENRGDRSEPVAVAREEGNKLGGVVEDLCKEASRDERPSEAEREHETYSRERWQPREQRR
jgi:hypothetical protein